MKVNIKMLSEITGFSQATISNALNNKKGVNKKTAELIFTAARESGYLGETRITNIKLVIYKNSGIVVSDTPFFSSLIDGVETASRAAGYQTTICHLDRQNSNYELLRDQLLNDANCAILLLATEMTEEDILAFESSLAPIVVLDGWFEKSNFDSVLISNTDSVYTAVNFLIEKGHKKIGYLKGSIRIKNFLYREIGYKRAHEEAGISVNSDFAFSLTPTMDGAYADMLKILKSNVQLPTAFFADNDIIALGAMRALQEYGYTIPKDIAIIGFDDLPFSSISYPSLSTIKVYKQEMGETAVRRIIEIMKSESDVKTKIQVCPVFIARESV